MNEKMKNNMSRDMEYYLGITLEERMLMTEEEYEEIYNQSILKVPTNNFRFIGCGSNLTRIRETLLIKKVEVGEDYFNMLKEEYDRINEQLIVPDRFPEDKNPYASLLMKYYLRNSLLGVVIKNGYNVKSSLKRSFKQSK